MPYYDENKRELKAEELDQLFNPFYGVECIYRHGLLFLDIAHLKSFEELTPGKLRGDSEWTPTVYMLTMDGILRDKAACHIKPGSRDINWYDILDTDFGSGHYAYIYWAYGLWGGCSWGGWEGDNGKMIPKVDTISRSYSMDSRLKIISLVATAYRWGLHGQIPALAKIFTER